MNMPLTSYLEELLPELLEMVLQHLSVADIGSLRLTSREMAIRSAQSSYKQSFREHSICWNTPKQLHDFAEVTNRGQLGILLNFITFYSLAPLPVGYAEDPNDSMIQLVATALSKLKLIYVTLTIKYTGVRSFSPSISTPQPAPSTREQARESALYTFSHTSAALAIANTPIKSFEIFDPPDRCSVSTTGLQNVLDTKDLKKSLSSLLCLSINLCGPPTPEAGANNDNANGYNNTTPSLQDPLSRLLSLCPKIGFLDLHWISQHGLSDICPLPINFSPSSLRNLELSGLYTTSHKLLYFVRQNSGLRTLMVKDIHLIDGSKFRPLFDFLTSSSEMHFLCSIWMADLFEPQLIHFRASNESHVSVTGFQRQWNKLHLIGEETKRRIEYQNMTGRG